MFGDEYEHSARLGYDADKYGLDTAKSEYRVSQVSYKEYQRRLRTRDNVLEAFFADLFLAREGVGYQYSEMPIRTSTDERYRGENNYEERYGLDAYFSNGTPKLDMDGKGGVDTKEERQEFLFEKAEELCDDIDEMFIVTNRYPEYAIAQGFIIPADARANAQNYCHYLLGTKNRKGELERRLDERRAEVGGRVSDEEYAAYLAEREKYSTILYDYLSNDNIPWRIPRYAKLRSDTESMYFDEDGNPSDRWEYVMGRAKKEDYSYGGKTGAITPIVSPIDQGNYDYQTFTWDTMLDDEGNPINDMGAIYDEAEAAGTVVSGIGSGREALDVMTNDGALKRGDTLVPLDDRGWEVMESTYPEYLKDMDKDSFEKMFGIDSYMPGEESNPDSGDNDSSGKGSGGNAGKSYGGGRSYGRRSYSSYGRRSYSSYGGGSYSSNYNPKIYSSSHSVYSTKAAGMSTRQPYRATTSYLRPSFYTSGSRRAYNRLS